MSKKRVLLIVEGEKSEPKLFRKLFEEYGLDVEYEIYTYGTTIHELYERMFAKGDPDDLSLLSVLKERENDPDKLKMLDGDYSDVLLVFDYDPHDNRFNSEGLKEMLAFFGESTDEGKLYLNYPMVEACKHFKSLPVDERFLDRFVSLSDVRTYKRTVGQEACCQNYERDFNKALFDAAILMTVEKIYRINGSLIGGKGFAELCFSADLEEVLERQNAYLADEGKIYVLGTSLMFIPDYSTELVSVDGVSRQVGK